MKKILYTLLVLTLFNCEDVIDLKVPTSEPKLVIDASLNWFEGTDGSNQQIKLSLSAPYFDTEIPAANNAIVIVEDTDGNTFDFIEDGNTGVYKTTDFIPVLNKEYTLIISYDGETYKGSESLKSVVPVADIQQNNNGGLNGQSIELNVFYQDPENVKNFYLFEFISKIPDIPVQEVFDDKFTDGNLAFVYYLENALKAGDKIAIKNYGITEQHFEFMSLLLSQNTNDDGSPFQAQPATVRGNCVNITNPDNFPFGYFRVSQANYLLYTVQ